MNLVFACDSIWNWEAEKHFAILKEENPDLVQAAQKGEQTLDPETGKMTTRRGSTASRRRGSLGPARNYSLSAQQTNGEKGTVEHK